VEPAKNSYTLEIPCPIVAAVDRGVGSLPAVAALFQVSINSVANYLQLRQQTGSLQPRPNPGGRQPAIPPQRYDELRQLFAQQPDLTLEQTRQRMALNCSLAAICRTLKKLGLNRKKKRWLPLSSSVPTSRRPARSGSSGRRN
jgi:transposase